MMCAKGLAKLIEECGELVQVCGKKLAYFTTNEHPDGGKSLDERLEEEMGDVMAACWLVAGKLGLDPNAISERTQRKLGIFTLWDERSDNNEHGVDAPRSAP